MLYRSLPKYYVVWLSEDDSSKNIKRKKSYKTHFNHCWLKKYSGFLAKRDDHNAFCNLCSSSFGIWKMGERDIERHISGKIHQMNVSASKTQSHMGTYMTKGSITEQVSKQKYIKKNCLNDTCEFLSKLAMCIMYMYNKYW